jgi:exosortase/archaeosortase family protein
VPIGLERAAAAAAAVPLRLLLLLGALGIAFHYSLASLFAAWSYDSPLADLALVPLLAAALFVAAALRHRHVGAVGLGRPDVVVAAVLLAAALFVVAAGPAFVGSYFWLLRLDLLTLPLAGAAFVALLFGLRSLVAFIFPLFFLLFAWPLPYTVFLEQLLSQFTAATGWAVTRVVAATDLAAVVGDSGDTRLAIAHGDGSFTVSIASSCSGINSAVGFLVVGLACLYVIRGTVTGRLTWLLVGLVLVWLLNVVRIVAIVGVGRLLGEEAAIDVLHPVAGLLALNIAFALLLLALPRFGLALRNPLEPATSDTPLGRVVPAAERAGLPPTLLRRLGAVVVVVSALALANGQLAELALAYDNDGLPAVQRFTPATLAGGSWKVRRVGSYPWSRSSFGDGSTWVRYELRPRAGRVPPGKQFTIWVDSILTPDVGALNAFPVRECYDFHGFEIYADQRVRLPGGVVGELIAYRNESGGLWHALTWQWPVTTPDGRVQHERMVMLASAVGVPLQPAVAQDRWRVRGLVLDLVNRFSERRDPNRRLTRALVGAASELIEARLRAPRRTVA